MQNHPSLCFPSEIENICKPLKQLNISYFSHVKIDKNKKISAICNNPRFYEYYFGNKYYNADIHMATNDNLGNFILWDALTFDNKSAALAQEATEFGVKHVFTIVEKNQHDEDFYHFATHLNSTRINQIYIANIDLLKLFILHFKEKINHAKELKVGHDIKFNLDLQSNDFAIKNDDDFNDVKFDRPTFLNDFNCAHSLLHKDTHYPVILSTQQMKCFRLLAIGLSAKQIARKLNISYRTVEHHIEKLKKQLGCQNIKELLAIYASQV